MKIPSSTDPLHIIDRYARKMKYEVAWSWRAVPLDDGTLAVYTFYGNAPGPFTIHRPEEIGPLMVADFNERKALWLARKAEKDPLPTLNIELDL